MEQTLKKIFSLSDKQLFLLLLILFTVFRLVRLTAMPIFNDEAIYLDWGWRETHVPGLLFYSLYDAKQPLLFWLFGFSQTLFPDQLWAGRFVSVLAGAVTLIGIWKIGLTFFTRKIAVLAGIFYVLLPVFSFFDRQALVESAIGAVGVWALYYLAAWITTERVRYAIYAGIVLGIGFFIKSSALLFLVAALVLIVWLWYINPKKRTIYQKGGTYLILSMLLIDGLLFLQHLFWETLGSNDRYVYSLGDFLTATPYVGFLGKLSMYFSHSAFFLTPFFVGAAIVGIWVLGKKREKSYLLLTTWFLIPFFIQLIFARNAEIRYLVSYLPLLTLFASVGVFESLKQSRVVSYVLLGLIIIPMVVILGFQLFSTPQYFQHFARSEKGYYSGQTAGNGIQDMLSYIEGKALTSRVLVGTALNTGNPESAVIVAFHKKPEIVTSYVTGQQLGGDLGAFDCIRFSIPAYFVARNEETGDIGRFLQKEKVFPKGDGQVLTVYRFRTDCPERVLDITVPEKL